MRFLAFLFLGLSTGLSCASTPEQANEILAQLTKIGLDKKQVYNVRDITLRRDVFAISFNRGAIAFTEPVEGKVTGAVFIGNGEIVGIPPDSIEKEQLFKFTGSPILNETFTGAFFRFTDSSYQEVLQQMADRAQEDVTDDQVEQFAPWSKVILDRAGLLNYRIMRDLLAAEPKPFFLGELNGAKHGWFNIMYDERLDEESIILSVRTRDEHTFTDLWASFDRRGESRALARGAAESKAVVDILDVKIDASIDMATRMECRTTVRLRSVADGERLIGFDLSRFLRVSAVTLDDGRPAPFYQHPFMNDEEIRRNGANSVVVILPEPLRRGQEIRLDFTYSGDVIEKRGTGVFYVGERGLWYPNAGHQDRAAFHLTFHFPQSYSLVATGQKMREWEDASLKHSEWKSNAEFPVAGFNYGDFTILSDTSGPFSVHVGVNNDVETIYKEIAARRALQKEMTLRAATGRFPNRANPVGPGTINVSPDYSVFSTKSLAENILKEVRATVSYFSETLLPYPYGQLTVSQFPVNYSQGWPTLLYVSTLSFFTADQREKLGLSSDHDFLYTELVRAHEIAHQWFGNMVGWKSYRDQWISEGFANYAAAMYLEQKYKDRNPLKILLEEARETLLETTGPGKTKEAIGPIWLGSRLSSSESPEGYMETVYNKSTWVLHMLRSLMRDPARPTDQAFLAMVRDFLKSYEGKVASTADFKKIAEKHITKDMDIEGNRSLNWFFDEWILGTGIPTYSLEFRLEPASGGFLINGRVRQEDVSANFAMPVPIYAQFGGRNEFLGRVVVSNDGGDFRYLVKNRPSGVVLDPEVTVLAQRK